MSVLLHDPTASPRLPARSSPVSTRRHLFLGGLAPDCADAADADDNGDIQITDPVYTLNRLFRGGPELPAPGATSCGSDPTDDALGCQSYNPCGA
ncbi:MAG: hypothetical protein O7J95_13505 [Planctomycetota bacterium]|nr:hypothetical protein [Planctomycetota bacterium]